MGASQKAYTNLKQLKTPSGLNKLIQVSTEWREREKEKGRHGVDEKDKLSVPDMMQQCRYYVKGIMMVMVMMIKYFVFIIWL